ncbi:MAG TPA: DUF402 domain-containing protein [Anaerolineales bacterium]|nr:DUF402 domain-containing protein [Anaerolineales bacterium]HRK89430.1 DUF402 domain-containing protein [Anaerolineales bacterium]
MQNPSIGDMIHVHACKADGTTYRSWQAVIESMTADRLVTIAPAGSAVVNRDGRVYHIEYHLRAYYWFGKFHNLIEVFEPGGNLLEIYINVASPPEWVDGVLKFKDHELDISKYPPKPAELVDEDEFAEAVLTYQYSPEFQEKLYAVARESLELAENWQAKPCPTFGDNHD